MKPRTRSLIAAALCGGALGLGNVAHADHCSYTQQVSRGTHEVCEMPVSAESCEAIDTRDSVSDAEFDEGACPVEDVVGTCDKGATQIMYYSGDPSQLKIGCGFQGGTWLNGYASPSG